MNENEDAGQGDRHVLDHVEGDSGSDNYQDPTTGANKMTDTPMMKPNTAGRVRSPGVNLIRNTPMANVHSLLKDIKILEAKVFKGD